MLDANPSNPIESKIMTLDDASSAAAQAREAGRSVVLCHGAFDLVHVGHIRHFAAAKKMGDVLCVSLTADAFINKGPGRPVFSQNLRAEMVAALGEVDLVTIVEHVSAIPAIEAIKPTVYVKGAEYREHEKDVTGNIVKEREAAERSGGRLEFTDEIVFSSSTLVNRHFDYHDTKVKAFLQSFTQRHSAGDVFNFIEKASDLRVAIVGDVIIDEYNYAEPMGKAAKENMIATLARGGECFAGGVIAAANHVAGLVKHVDIVTMVGEEPEFTDLIRESIHDNVELHIVERSEAPTTRKVRYIDPGPMRKLFEVYHMEDRPLPVELQAEVDGKIRECISSADLVIVTDFGHGMLAPSSIKLLADESRFLALNAQTNSGNAGFNLVTKYPAANFVCIDTPEARLAVGDKFCDMEEILLQRLPSRLKCDTLILTLGKQGCLVNMGNEAVSIPAFAQNVVDTVGAGDAFFAIAAPLAAVGAPSDFLGFVGNVAGALKVEIVGHRKSIDKVSLLKAITALLK